MIFALCPLLITKKFKKIRKPSKYLNLTSAFMHLPTAGHLENETHVLCRIKN